jgi:predicted MFS family arabinose efflux permease
MSIQFWETANRSSTDRAGFFQDNGMALLGVIVGFIYLALLVTKALRMSQDQILLLLQCLGWGGLDFVFGVLISQRIAASAKEREEE